MTRVAIVGVGGIAQAHAASYRSLGGRAELVAAADVDADRLASFGDTWSVPALYPDLDSLLAAADVDLVSVCTPPGLHHELALTCLKREVTVLCEKPPTLSLAELDEIIAAEAESGGHFATVFQNRFCAAPRALQRLITDSDAPLGQPMNAVCHTLWYRPDAYFDVPWRGRWDLEGGGPTIGHGIHQLDLLLMMLGEWRDVVGVAARVARPIDTEDWSAAIIRFASGAMATVVNSLLSPRETTYLRFDFEDATIELAPAKAYGRWELTVTGPAGQELPAGLAADFPTVEHEGHPAQIAAVLKALDAGSPPPVTSTQARSTMELIAAIYASAFTGRRVERGELGPDSPHYHRMCGSDSPFPQMREVSQA
jgi:predicted dehydrogenase